MDNRRSHWMASWLSLSFRLARRLASTLGWPVVRAADRVVKTRMRRLFLGLSRCVSVVRAHPRVSGTAGLSLLILTFVLLPDRNDPEPEEFEFVPIDLFEQHVGDVVPSQPLTLPAAISDQSPFAPANTVVDETSTRTVADVKAISPLQKSVEQAGFANNPPQPARSEKSRVAWLTGEIEEYLEPGVAQPGIVLDQYPFNSQ